MSELQPKSLPPELWLAIIHFLPPQMLQPLRGVNRVFFDLAMDAQYRRVTIDRVDGYLRHVLDSLRNPDIARRVYSLDLSLSPLFVHDLLWKENKQKLSALTRSSRPDRTRNQNQIQKLAQRMIQTIKATLRPPLHHNNQTYSTDSQGLAPIQVAFTDITQALVDIIPLLINLGQFTFDPDLDIKRQSESASTPSVSVDSNLMSSVDFSAPYVDQIWQLHAQNLVEFSLAATSPKINALVVEWLGSQGRQLSFPFLKVFIVKVRYPTGDTEDTNSLNVEGREKEVLQTQHSLSLLINSFNSTLEQLTLRCIPMQNLSIFYLSLTQFEHLRALDVDVSSPSPLVDANEPSVSITMPLTTFIQSNHLTLEKLTLFTSLPISPSSAYQFSFAALHLPHLHSLEMSAEVMALSWVHTLAFLAHHASTLESLAIEGPITPSELARVVGALNHRDIPCLLSCLSISLYQVDAGLFEMLAKSLWRLKVLKLRIQRVACESRSAIYPGQFFPDNRTSADAHPFSRSMLQSETLKHWGLQDITIKRRSCCRDLYLWGLMLLCASCVPSIRSFAENGDMKVPLVSLASEKSRPGNSRKSVIWCSKNRVYHYISDGVQR